MSALMSASSLVGTWVGRRETSGSGHDFPHHLAADVGQAEIATQRKLPPRDAGFPRTRVRQLPAGSALIGNARPLCLYTALGTYTINLIVSDANGINKLDSVSAD
jgi:hypothetical protein